MLNFNRFSKSIVYVCEFLNILLLRALYICCKCFTNTSFSTMCACWFCWNFIFRSFWCWGKNWQQNTQSLLLSCFKSKQKNLIPIVENAAKKELAGFLKIGNHSALMKTLQKNQVPDYWKAFMHLRPICWIIYLFYFRESLRNE